MAEINEYEEDISADKQHEGNANVNFMPDHPVWTRDLDHKPDSR